MWLVALIFYYAVLLYIMLYYITEHFHHCRNFCWKTVQATGLQLHNLPAISSLCFCVLRYSLLLRKYMLKIFSKSFKVCIFTFLYLINIGIHKWTYLFVCFFPCTVPMVCGATSLIYIFPEILGLISGFSGHLFVSSCKDYRFFPYFCLMYSIFFSSTN